MWRCRHPNLPVERLWRIAAKRAILATGAEERPLVFGGNDKPGVMMAGAMRTYLNRYGVVARARRWRSSPMAASGYRTASDLAAQGVEISRHHRYAAARCRRRCAGGRSRHSSAAVIRPPRDGIASSGVIADRGGFDEIDRLRRARHVRRLVADHPSCLSARRKAGLVGGDDRLSWRRRSAVSWSRRIGCRAIDSVSGCLADGAEKARRVVDSLGRNGHAG